MNSRQVLTIVLAGVFLLGACDQEARMASTGFRLPDGNAETGREVFLYMQCHQCHSIKGEQLPVIPGQEPPYVKLGGEVTQVKTYGTLITSIINPSHKLARGYAKELVAVDGKSKMYVYNDHMTVQELIDIVMFLQPHYDVVVPEFYYPLYQ